MSETLFDDWLNESVDASLPSFADRFGIGLMKLSERWGGE